MKINLIKVHDKGEIALFTPTIYMAKDNESFEVGFAFLNWSVFLSFEPRKQESDINTSDNAKERHK